MAKRCDECKRDGWTPGWKVAKSSYKIATKFDELLEKHLEAKRISDWDDETTLIDIKELIDKLGVLSK